MIAGLLHELNDGSTEEQGLYVTYLTAQERAYLIALVKRDRDSKHFGTHPSDHAMVD
jgi:hypothetical protein